jgi:hypothetical protein
METATQLAADMLVYAPEHTLVGGYLHSTYDAHLIGQLLALMAPDRDGMRIDVQSSDYERLRSSLEGKFKVCYVQYLSHASGGASTQERYALAETSLSQPEC